VETRTEAHVLISKFYENEINKIVNESLIKDRTVINTNFNHLKCDKENSPNSLDKIISCDKQFDDILGSWASSFSSSDDDDKTTHLSSTELLDLP
jgi:hypothetical protein